MPTVSGFTVILADRVRETTSTTGTGTYSLNGAGTGFRTFVSGIGSGNRTSYGAVLGSSWEVGVGTVTTGAPPTLSRDVIIASSNSGNAVSWGAGTKDIWCDTPAVLLSQIYETPVASVKLTTFTSSGTFTTDPKCISALIECVGAGGGGGGASGIASGGAMGGFGGGGEHRYSILGAGTLGASKAVTIGAGGTAGTGAGAGNGGNGGNTILAGLITCIGGGGGAGMTGTAANSTALGGGGGAAGSGGVGIPGGDGGAGVVVAGDPVRNGVGGSSFLGGGAGSVSVNTAGKDAVCYGTGASGGVVSNNTGNRSGGVGAGGWMRFTEFLKP